MQAMTDQLEPQRVPPPAQPTVKAGWYADTTSGRMRWWDGVAWTDTYGGIAQPPPKTNHIFHLLMSLVTAGLWIPVWIIVGIANSTRR
jgi:hypothetical protein